MPKRLHIVCLDEPDPPDYGGAIDMYFKIAALHQIGTRIVLHAFHYKAGRHIESLKTYCEDVHLYNRKNFLSSGFAMPFIVGSRINTALIKRLNADRDPILLEGIHCAGIIPQLNFKERSVVRLHNDEARYYNELAKVESHFVKRLYLKRESKLLHKFQKSLSPTLAVAAISSQDIRGFEYKYNLRKISFVPCFHPWKPEEHVPANHAGANRFCLYHGNMSIAENEEAAKWLVLNVFRYLHTPFVIAGKSISSKLKASLSEFPNIRAVDNPSILELDELIRQAHINVLPSMNATGVKLKLIHALFTGKFCITNTAGVEGSGIETGIVIADQPMSWLNKVQELMQIDFSSAQKRDRAEFYGQYDNEKNARKLSELWSHYQ